MNWYFRALVVGRTHSSHRMSRLHRCASPANRLRIFEMVTMLALLSALLGACGEDLANTGVATGVPTIAPTASTSVTASPSQEAGTARPVQSIDEVGKAVIRIEVDGSFRAIGEAQIEARGGGSGFFINGSGLAVTNNHVVTGASLLRIFLDGEEGYRNARVVAVSECSDLAIIQVEGKVERYFEWYNGTISTAMPIYVAGFPLDAQKITLVDGIVSQAKSDGQTTWASVESVLEHTAPTLPGNSGGPVFTKDLRVVGINYAGNAMNQHFAISAQVAQPIIDRIKHGTDIESIGINGEVFTLTTENGEQFRGTWVVSVQPGTPASTVGIKPGDILLAMNNLTLAQNGTMQDYCDVLRSIRPDAIAPIKVYRQDTGEILEGELNGKELKASASLPEQAVTPTAQAATAIQPLNLTAEQNQQQLDAHARLVGQLPKVFTEDFQNARSLKRWPQGEDGTYGRTLVSNIYRLTMKQPDGWNGTLWEQGTVGGSYMVELTVLADNGANGTASVGIIFGHDKQGNLGIFVLRNDHTWEVSTYRNNQYVSSLSAAATPSQHITQGVNANTLWVVRTPERVEFWINAALVAIGPADVATGAYVGVIAQSWSDITAPVSVDVDNLVVRQA